MAGANSIIGWAASHMAAMCASNWPAVPGSRMTIRLLSCAFSPEAEKLAGAQGHAVDLVAPEMHCRKYYSLYVSIYLYPQHPHCCKRDWIRIGGRSRADKAHRREA